MPLLLYPLPLLSCPSSVTQGSSSSGRVQDPCYRAGVSFSPLRSRSWHLQLALPVAQLLPVPCCSYGLDLEQVELGWAEEGESLTASAGEFSVNIVTTLFSSSIPMCSHGGPSRYFLLLLPVPVPVPLLLLFLPFSRDLADN
eukprot:764283-Hanusia_phi.AAC.1